MVTQKDIARETGLDQSTVSLALREDPRVNAQTRQQVLEVARRLGYRKDPMLTALSSYRSDIQRKSYHGNLAWLNDPKVYELDHYDNSVYYHYRRGAQERALEHGYKLEIVEVDMDAPNQRRLSDILYHRGIEGIILPPLRVVGPALKLNWQHFVAVTFGWTVIEPRFHSVSPNHVYNSTELVRNLRSRGYERIAAVLFMPPQHLGQRHFHLWAHGVEVSVLQQGAQDPIPTLRLTSTNADQAAVLQEWYRQYRPDAVAVMLECSEFVEESLNQIKILCPRDIGIANFVCMDSDQHFSGIRENSYDIGMAAVDVLVGAIRRREFGVPAIRRMLQIEGQWTDGETIA
ncbi:LacI family DNA-binding transcriptional regulator [Coraliomargarita parva]|uniref:LacI family DNA-binding transcriptional regulator n=1 Tax=Coraliomargarita parva TaxID=3014050 RepID=UPI0022B526D6|nr:LacI family DNA-binding transcriptional regulator [Coraliomargarita parva]